MRRLAAPLALAAARARRRPRRWLLPALGIALPTVFAGAVAVTGAVAGDQAARSALDRLSPLERTVRVTAQGTRISSLPSAARRALRGLGLGRPSEVLLLRPVRLSGVVVQPAAIRPLDRWLTPSAAREAGRCAPRRCAVVLAGPGRVPARLATRGARLAVVSRARLRSAVPLGFAPTAESQGPVLLGGDVRGLEGLPGLRGVYRTGTWVAPLRVRDLHSWQLEDVQAQLRRAQSAVSLAGSEFSLTAPSAGLAHARAAAGAAPRRLLLTGGGAVAALALFCLLAAGGLRRDQRAELARLQAAGATTSQALAYVAGEAALVCGTGLIAGAALAIGAGAVLAALAGEPVGAILAHTLLTGNAALVLVCAWVAATSAMAVFVLARSPRVADSLAFAAACALVAALAVGARDSGSLALLLAPLACLAAAVVVTRAAAVALRGGERLARRGPLLVRLALVNVARSPAFPSLAIGFIAISVGLGGFALAYRATLARGAADEAANRVPLDATVSPARDFTTPLDRAPLGRWRRAVGGDVFPVRRTDAAYAGGSGAVTVPALGVPAAALPMIHGWRADDASAPLAGLAQRLRPAGRTRTPGPRLPRHARRLAVRAYSPSLDVTVTADLRSPQGSIRRVRLGVAGEDRALLHAPLPRGRWEVEALELDEPTGLEITNGHQNGENPAAATQSIARATLGPLLAPRDPGMAARALPIGSWRPVGAASAARRIQGGRALRVRFATTGTPGIVRPAQPTDVRPVPLLADPTTAAAAGPGGRLGLTVDGQPVSGRIVGVLRRFPTVAASAAGFIVADEAMLASALDAQLPGQGRPDELWISTPDAGRLKVALRTGPLADLHAAYRATVEGRLLDTPLAHAVLGTLIAAMGLAGGLAVVALLVAFVGGGRDERVEHDLEAQGVGPRGLRAELRARFLLASLLGIAAGVAIAVLLARLAVATVRAAGAVAVPRPPLVTVLPWNQLAAAAAAALVLLTAATWLATSSLVGNLGAVPPVRRRGDETAAARAAGATR